MLGSPPRPRALPPREFASRKTAVGTRAQVPPSRSAILRSVALVHRPARRSSPDRRVSHRPVVQRHNAPSPSRHSCLCTGNVLCTVAAPEPSSTNRLATVGQVPRQRQRGSSSTNAGIAEWEGYSQQPNRHPATPHNHKSVTATPVSLLPTATKSADRSCRCPIAIQAGAYPDNIVQQRMSPEAPLAEAMTYTAPRTGP